MYRPFHTYRYLFPPRPASKAPPTALPMYQKKGYIGEPKLDGSCGVLFLDTDFTKLMNRYHRPFSREVLSNDQLHHAYKGKGFMVVTGEYMNKSKKGKDGKPFRAFVIWDILVYEGEYLIGSTKQQRLDLLDKIYDRVEYDGFIDQVGPDIYLTKSFEDLEVTYNELVKIDMYEGFVMKNPQGKLKTGYVEKNNNIWQAKVRKPTKNYSH